MHRYNCLVCALVFVFGPGCQGQAYHADTTLHPNGRLERTIVQPAAESTFLAKDQSTWKLFTFAKGGSITSSLVLSKADPGIHARDDQHNQLFARQAFASFKDIPDHVRFNTSDDQDLKPGRLLRRYEHRSHVLMVEHEWSETLTDCVDIADMRIARDELADLCISLGCQALAERWGNELDFTALRNWLETDGRQWWKEMVDAVYIGGAAGMHRKDGLELQHLIARVCRSRGLDLLKDGKLLADPPMSDQIKEFVIELGLKHIRDRKGNSIDRARVKQILDEIEGVSQPSPTLFRQSLKKVLSKHHGSEEQFQKRAGLLLRRITGHYLLDLGVHRFDYVMTVPGFVTETNGEILANNRVRWRFPVSDAFPFGYSMKCTSLEPNASIQTLLFGSVTVAERGTMLELLDFLARNPSLKQGLESCVKAKSLKPLKDHRSRVASELARIDKSTPRESTRKQELDTINELFTLLKITP